MQGAWTKKTHQYSSGENYQIGKIVVAEYFYSGGVGRNDPKKYACKVHLPGISIKPEYANHETIEAAKAIVERVVSKWFERLKEGE